MKKLLANLRARITTVLEVPTGEASVLRADVLGDRCYSLTGGISAAGRALFEITISAEAFTTVYEVDDYNTALYHYKRILRGKYPVGHAAQHTA